jgi:hypothetical protein
VYGYLPLSSVDMGAPHGREESNFDQFEDLDLICGGFLEHLEMGGSHDVGEENPRRRFKRAMKETECVRKEKWRQ